MKSYLCFTPSAPGKPGQLLEVVGDESRQQYLEPLAVNDDLGKLRANVHEARAKLQHAKARGKGVAEAQKAFETAKSALDKLHLQQKQERQRLRTGGDHPFAPQSQFMPVRDYSVNDADDNDTSGRSFDNDDELEAAIRVAVAAIETAQSDGASWAEVLRLEAALKDLRDKLPNPSAPPAQTTAAPPRKSHIERPAPPQGPASQAAPAGKKAGWNKFLAALDVKLAKQRKALQTTHGTDVCCEGAYKCARCKAKAAAT